MKYLQEFRDGGLTQKILGEIHAAAVHPWTLMEICGGQTHSIIKSGLDQLLPNTISLVHGPGCPVCVTPLEMIDKAIALASMPEIIFTSYGDMLRVPGSEKDLFTVRAAGGDVRIVVSPLDALKIAEVNPNRTVIFFGIGFETTAPANAMAILQAKERNLSNFGMLVSHVTVPAAIIALLESPEIRINAFLAAGHVCTVMGFREYQPIALKYQVPVVVTGFEPVDLAYGILLCIQQLESGKHQVQNAYPRSVKEDGNVEAQKTIRRVFEICDRAWRGIGVIPNSGYRLQPEFAHFDAELRFPDIQIISTKEPTECISGLILQGLKKPDQCSAFGNPCTPVHPMGATMVSAEGACSAYYQYGRYKESLDKSK